MHDYYIYTYIILCTHDYTYAYNIKTYETCWLMFLYPPWQVGFIEFVITPLAEQMVPSHKTFPVDVDPKVDGRGGVTNKNQH